MTGLRKRNVSVTTTNTSSLINGGESEGDSGFVTPDSTTTVDNKPGSCCCRAACSHVVGEEVLSHSKDGRFYLGTIVQVDEDELQCLVQFADGTSHWSLYKDLHSLKLPASETHCVTCKSAEIFEDNCIVFCSVCRHGFHQRCAEPVIFVCSPAEKWTCARCIACTHKHANDKSLCLQSCKRAKKTSQAYVSTDYDSKHKLPYDLELLHWDTGHKMNKEQTYCYCGGPGEWYNRMLQCRRCLQWFHEACIDSLHYSVLYGDRFYVYVCNFCNENFGEFVYRMDLGWLDVVHLALFNLTLLDGKTYFDCEISIMCWINNNWEALQAPLELQKVCVEDRRNEVQRVLESNRSRFKCGREMRKRACVWALRCRVPPPVPYISLPLGAVTDENVTQMRSSHRSNPHSSPPLPRTVRVKDGKSEEHCSGPSLFSPVKKRALILPLTSSSPLMHRLHDKLGRPSNDAHVYCETSNLQHGSSTLNKYNKDASPNASDSAVVPALASSEKICSHIKKRKRKGELDKLVEDDGCRKLIGDVSSELSVLQMLSDPSSSWKRRGRTSNSFPLSSVEGPGRDVSMKNILLTQYHRSVSSYSSSSSLADDSSDDSSSRGTLDSFIPPLSNFEGHNNPFLHLFPASNSVLNSCSSVSKPFKKKLCENDIRISKNGEVKRRKLRRKRFGRNYMSSGCCSEVNEGEG
ncbi:Zinc finger FYVE/PHD-type, partial [Trinorchestia longiramus]